MSSFVLDASTVLAWLLRESRLLEAEAAIVQAGAEGAAAPRLLGLEVPNGLRNRIRRGLLTRTDRDQMLEDFLQVPVEWDDQLDARALVAISDTHDLTIYDAAYLELAARLKVRLSTLDLRLANAARAMGVAILTP